MITIKEYKAIDFISLKTAQGDIVSVHRDEIERHLNTYKGYKVPELIRVIELAEEALYGKAEHILGGRVTTVQKTKAYEKIRVALSEIRKLKGE